MAYYNGGGNNNDFPAADIPTFFIIMAFIFAWPLGFALLVVKSLSRAQRAAQNQHRQVTTIQTVEAPGRPAATKPKKNTDWSQILFWVGLAITIIALLSALTPLRWLFVHGFSRYDLWSFLGSMGWALAGGALMLSGRRLRRKNRLLKKYKAVVGDRRVTPIADIAPAIPSTYNQACDHLQEAIDKNLFGPNAYLDMRSGSLVLHGAPPAPAEDTPPAKEMDTYSDIIRQIRAVNDAIPDAAMSNKIDRLEDLTVKIFKLVDERPDKLPQLRSFMDYYLPTALKLLGAYSQFDRQGVEGENISASKKKIEDTMDILVSGFEKQLDQLFQDDAMDVKSDIKVLEDMMAQDGLSGNQFDLSGQGRP